MATTAAIAAAAIGAAGSIGGGLIANKGAGDAAKAAGANPRYAYLPKYASALNHQVARALSLNIDKVPPSFGQYVESGGTALFPFESPGITPKEARQLGFRDKYGNVVPTMTPDQARSGALTPEQLLFMAKYDFHRGHTGTPLYNIGRLAHKLDRLDALPSTPGREKKISGLEDRLNKLVGGVQS